MKSKYQISPMIEKAIRLLSGNISSMYTKMYTSSITRILFYYHQDKSRKRAQGIMRYGCHNCLIDTRKVTHSRSLLLLSSPKGCKILAMTASFGKGKKWVSYFLNVPLLRWALPIVNVLRPVGALKINI